MAEILLLGTFHFMESSMDFYSGEIQNELDKMVRKLMEFQPDAIAIEAAVDAQECVDESYKVFHLADLQDPIKMQNETLGEICMYGKTYPITYDNESIQIGYRLGKLLKHSKIHAIDDDTILNMDILQKLLFRIYTKNKILDLLFIGNKMNQCINPANLILFT